jgi:hypothetical protein
MNGPKEGTEQVPTGFANGQSFPRLVKIPWIIAMNVNPWLMGAVSEFRVQGGRQSQYLASMLCGNLLTAVAHHESTYQMHCPLLLMCCQ